MKRVSLSLPDDLVSDLDAVARILGSSRAGLLAGMVSGMNLPELRRVLELHAQARDSSDPEVAKRYRGESAEFIVSQLQSALKPQGSLFDEN